MDTLLLLSLLLQVQPPVATDARLAVELVAVEPEIVTPTGVAVDAKGRIWAIESNTHFPPKNYTRHPSDKIVIFEDYAPDGRARKVSMFADGFRYGMGLALRGNDVYFATRWEVWTFKQDDASQRKLLAKLETKGDYPHNGLSGFAFDPEGRLVFGLGENLGLDYRLVGADGTTLSGGGEGGNIYRIQTDGSGLVRLATGFWNPFHVGFDAFGRLFAVDNDPDSRPPNRLLHIVPDGDYGYRFRNGRKGLHPFTAWDGELPGTLPMVSGTGEGASGVLAYEHDALPDEYRGALLVTSWGDHVIQRYRLEPRGASFGSRPETVIKGGENFRPVGIALAPDGSVVLTDWMDKSYNVHLKGRIWRIRAKTPVPTAAPSISHWNREVRAAAAAGKSKEELEEVLRKDSSPRARIQALWTGKLIDLGLADRAPEVRGEAARLCTDQANLLKLATTDPSPFVRMQALKGLRSADAAALESTLADPDPFLSATAIDALARSADPSALAASKDPRVRTGVLLALRQRNEAGAVAKFLADPDPGVRRAAIQWVGEAGLKEHDEALSAAASRPPVTREVFEAFVAAIEFLSATERHRADQVGPEFHIARMLEDARKPAELRALALRMLRPEHPLRAFPKLESLTRGPDPLRLEAVRALTLLPAEGAQKILRELASGTPAAVRREALLGLSHSAPASEETRAILIQALGEPELRSVALRSLSGAMADPKVREALEKLQDPEAAERLAIVALKPVAGRPEDNDGWRKVLAGPGDAAAGEGVFFHPRGPQCATCHTVGGRGGKVGPDLSTIGRSHGREKLVESILEPSKEVAPMFVVWRILTKDDDVCDGRIFQEDVTTGDTTLINAQAQLVKVKGADIRERRASMLSIMPEKLHAAMTRREFRDLLSFLESLR